ncbi:LOW QUALITY PROTEIN: protein chiffon [Drosophila serrata]|uniref:LOW QUALITY PROTEIN: protein chiffon n=1 Tax=Drosophila serrata TaxID=7274 RepID=UPI000A1D2F59|nr:LOW QUALITY PROTEIN: protein chiffon [Drosophila serrata]
MQPQSDKQSASRLATTTTSHTTAAAATSTSAAAQAATPPKVKVIKSKRPLCHFKFYLDICDHQLAKRIETDIKALGGHLEFFLSDSITHFITDKPEVSAATGRTPGTPGTPSTPTSHYQQDDGLARKPNQRQSRADAILSRVRRSTVGVVAHTSSNSTPTTSVKRSYTIWQTDYAQRFIKRIQTELKQYLEGKKESGGGAATASPHHIQLKKQYVKIESVKRNYRPYYHLIKQPDDWPKIDLSSEDGAFRLLTKSKTKEKDRSMTRRSLGSRTSQKEKPPAAAQEEKQLPKHPAVQQLKKQSAIPNSPRSNFREPKDSSEKQGGVCEICKLEYDILNIHLQSKDHELFAKNSENFLALDTLILSSANVNKFLAEEPEESELEMDVDETLSNEEQQQSPRQRPSPALREKSKRITKGKHSSEKFQAASPQTPSPGGKKASGNLPGSLSELQRQEHPTTAAATPTTTNFGRKKTTQNSGLSPPIRAMLPPSSLYKVVETREECATPPRRGRPPNQVDSPSLIVKFQKIRQTELQRLNGEAENFMFPRTAVSATTTRSSSELPTDVDRQTTSDVRGRYSISSASLDTSTSEAETKESSGLLPASNLRKRAQAVGRRRKVAGAPAGQNLLQRQLSTGSSSSNSNNQQRFPSAPIQPEEQESQPQPQSQPKLKIKLKQAQVVAATRKSSRTATAIVTAATASSRQQQQLRQTTGGRRMTSNLEDRMGESAKTKIKIKKEIIPQEENEEELQELDVLLENGDSEEEMELELESSVSSGSDEDYIAGNQSKTTKAGSSTRISTDTREQRAARRLSRLTINRSAGEIELTAETKSSPTRRSRGKSQKPSSPTKNNSKSKQPKAVPQSVDLIFDCSKSERLQQMQYTFESLPSAELWNRVFLRQDAGEEHYYTYYGSTRYRKLPYEMGPIPMAKTLPAHSCALCRSEQKDSEQKEQPQDDLAIKPVAKKEIKEEEAAQSSSSSSMYKHKKLHLLQRYQQEQEQLQQQLEGSALVATAIAAKCDSKASTPELLEREFASGSLGDRVQLIERVRSTSSSSCSNSQRSGITCRNKQISRITELPPRKSPREHASTLALVSCIIRQRQDSQSKTNSEAEEPPPPVVAAPKLRTPLKQEPVVAPSSPRTTRSQAATPVEELRFATEISETVKRMRRGQNKYDHSPPAPVPAPNPTPTAASSPARSRRLTPAVTQTLVPSYSRRLEFSTSQREAAKVFLGKGKGKRRIANPPAAGTVRPPAPQQPGMGGVFRGVRKLPSKKGLLEYEMEPCALKALDKAMQYSNPGFAAWQLDKYLELAGKEYDLDVEERLPVPEPVTEERREQQPTNSPQTPPPSDCCFTSEFDLYDLLLGSGGSGDDEEDLARGNLPPGGTSRRMSSQNLYATYYRKRKNLKSNRTGWPKSQRRRNGGGVLGRSMPNERINFLKMGLAEFNPIKQEPMETEEEQTTRTTTTSASREKLLSKEDEDDEGGGGNTGGGGVDKDDGASPSGDKQNPRQDVAMTPPATDVDELAEPPDADDNESLPEEDETMADSVDQQQDDEAEIEATDADVEEEEEEDDDEEEEDVFEDAYDEPQVGIKKKEEPSPEKRGRIPSISVSTPPEEHSTPGKKLLLTLHNGQRLQATSTPSSGQVQQQQRRTPQLNGSLGSCISPSEKLGDNSDIFTVSSDGLDTDLDLSNTQAGDSHDQHCPHQTNATTPKRKFDISKYAPPNNGKAASSCAAEAATAAVKSLAISQFLKKEVRVTCRRLRAPFRRFRYRR